jgi:signal recognition particle GTPase
METRKKTKLKKLKKLSKENQAVKERLEPSLIVSNLDTEKNVTRAIDRLGLRAERLNSDIGTSRANQKDWETSSNFSRTSSQMSATRHTKMQDSVLDPFKAMAKANHPIFRICLTGGPCAGKTTAMNTLFLRLQESGYRVFIVPEAATMLNKGGAFI